MPFERMSIVSRKPAPNSNLWHPKTPNGSEDACHYVRAQSVITSSFHSEHYTCLKYFANCSPNLNSTSNKINRYRLMKTWTLLSTLFVIRQEKIKKINWACWPNSHICHYQNRALTAMAISNEIVMQILTSHIQAM